MYIDDLNRKAKIGIVTVDANDNRSIRIRYTYPKGQRNVFYTGKITQANWNKAIQIATVIDEDINSAAMMTRYLNTNLISPRHRELRSSILVFLFEDRVFELSTERVIIGT